MSHSKGFAAAYVAVLVVLLAAGVAQADPTFTEFTNSTGQSLYAVRVSPDGNTVAISWAPTNPPGYNQRRLALYDKDGTNRRLIATTGQFGGGIASWSPDGKKLVFDKTRYGQAQGLYVISADGTGETRIYNSPSGWMPIYPSWSPGGDWITFCQMGLNYFPREIWRVRPDGTGAQRLTTGSDLSPRFSPDGESIAFWRYASGNIAQLWVMDSDGSNQRRVSPVGILFGGDGGLSWSPDGTEIVYYAYYSSSSTYGLRLVGADGTGDRHLADLQGSPGSPFVDWARDGSNRIYFLDLIGRVFYLVYQPPDTTPPTVTLTASPGTLWPPNHKLRAVELQASVSDDQDPSPTAVLRVQSSERDDAKGGGDGKTEGDIELLLTDGSTLTTSSDQPYVQCALSEFAGLKLRAERAGKGSGRTYTITLTATDAAGNTTTAVAPVAVPHDKGKRGR